MEIGPDETGRNAADHSGSTATRPRVGWGGPRASRGRGRASMLPPAIAVIVAAVSYGFLPNELLFVSPMVIPVIEIALLVLLLLTNRTHVGNTVRLGRAVSILLSSVVILTNLAALGRLVALLGSDADGMAMLIGGIQVWVTIVIGFTLLYWQIDRGGPVVRHRWSRKAVPLADWQFAEDANGGTSSEVGDSSSETSDWMPEFVDYLYLSLSNSSAYSSSDSPLSTRAKIFMGVQSTAAMLVSLVIVARAVGTIGA